MKLGTDHTQTRLLEVIYMYQPPLMVYRREECDISGSASQ